MGWFDTNNKHQQVIVTANAWDMQRIETQNRRRKWFIFFDVVVVITFLIGIALIYYKTSIKWGVVLVLIAIFITLYFIFRKRTKKIRNFSRGRNRSHRHHRPRRFRRR